MSKPILAENERRTAVELTADLAMVAHSLRVLRRRTPEQVGEHVDAALANLDTALDRLHAEPGAQEGARRASGSNGCPRTSPKCTMFAPGAEWVGAHDQDHRHVLALALNEVTAIEGTLAELQALADRIHAAVARLTV